MSFLTFEEANAAFDQATAARGGNWTGAADELVDLARQIDGQFRNSGNSGNSGGNSAIPGTQYLTPHPGRRLECGGGLRLRL